MNYTLITGASAGIGEGFAKQLAQAGNNLILVARRKDKLDILAKELSAQYKVEVQALAFDLAASGSGSALAKQVSEANWSVEGLINNAGFGDRGTFEELPLERQLNMIQLNVNTLVELTHCLLPNILKQQNGYIINVASTAAFQAGPNMAIYYATKAFVLSFTEALHEELKGQGVAVSALCPGATLSEFASEANLTDSMLFKAGAMTADQVVKMSLKRKNRAIVITGLKNMLMVWSGKISPRFMTRKIAHWLQA